MSVLDMDIGGELASDLFNLYDYMYRILVKANIDHQSEGVREVIGLLENLRTAWDEVAGVVEMRAEGKLDTEFRERHFAG